MAGLAVLLAARGYRVTGCDAMVNKLAGWLRERGIPVTERHHPAHLTPDVAWVIRSAAVPESCDEIREACARRIPVFKRGEVLPALLNTIPSIAIAGTHGKTTTTTFTTQLLTAAGLAPSFCIGGEVEVLGGVAGIGTGAITIAEADESDGTLALYAPDLAIVTNIEFDHMEHFATVEEFEECFRQFIRQARRRVIYCADDPRAERLGREREHAVSYGFSPSARLRATVTEEGAGFSRFAVMRDGHDLGEFVLPAPGRHNILNALASLAAALESGLDAESARTALGKVSLPRRRFERVIARDDLMILSDYAHHPTEIAALVKAARPLARTRRIAIFQPHRYTRTQALGVDFPPAFEGVDEVVLCPVYAASEAPLPGGSTWDLYGHFRRYGGRQVCVASGLRQAWDYCRDRLQLEDLLLIIGAGDVERIAGWAREELGRRRLSDLESMVARAIREIELQRTLVKGREPLARHTTLGVGGSADLWMDVGCRDDLLRILNWAHRNTIPFHIMGGGSNVLASDLGVRGIVARLAGEPFRQIRLEGGLLVAGAGLPLSRLLRAAADQGLSGAEFLADIPGTVGGAVSGNAGAWGHAVADLLVHVTCIDRDERVVTLRREELDFTYRGCPALRDHIILEAAFRFSPGAGASCTATHAEFARRREWMKGVRSAGSIFKNPPGAYAGQLIEQAGLKGFSVGGARILERHANIIATEPGATASDVLAVLEQARGTVQARTGIRLEPEIRLFL